MKTLLREPVQLVRYFVELLRTGLFVVLELDDGILNNRLIQQSHEPSKNFPADDRFPSKCRAVLCIIGLPFLLPRITSNMQNKQSPQRPLASLLGQAIGASGFLLSFALAVTMQIRQGNPGFLLIWSAAAMATLTCMRAHARWRKSFERMYAPDAVRTCYPARQGWRQNVEDIPFRDIPDASMSFSQ